MDIADFDQAYIRGDLVTAFQHHHVPGYQFPGGQAALIAVPYHQAFLHHHVAQGIQGAFCLALLHKAQDCIKQYNAGDDDGVGQHVAAHGGQRGGHHGGGQQDEHHGFIELLQETPPGRRPGKGYFIGSILLQPCRCSASAKTRGASFQCIKQLVCR